MHFDRVARGKIAVLALTDLFTDRGQFSGRQIPIIFEPGASALAVAIASVVGEIAAPVFGVLMEVDIAEVHFCIGWCLFENSPVGACKHVDIAG